MLKTLVARPSAPAGLVRRARVILLSAAGFGGVEIAARLDLSPEAVSRIRRRFMGAGVDGLADRPTIAKAGPGPGGLNCTGANAPSLTDDTGLVCLKNGTSSFTNVAAVSYWTATTYDASPGNAIYADLLLGIFNDFNKRLFVPMWPSKVVGPSNSTSTSTSLSGGASSRAIEPKSESERTPNRWTISSRRAVSSARTSARRMPASYRRARQTGNSRFGRHPRLSCGTMWHSFRFTRLQRRPRVANSFQKLRPATTP